MTLVFAHRGSKGTHPENTLAAFKEAIRVNVDGIELDIQLTKDQELVVIHDGDVNRTTNKKGLVQDYTLSEIKELDAGSWFDVQFKDEKIPTFAEVLELLVTTKYTGFLNVEIKTDEYDYEGIEKKIYQCLQSYELSCDIIISSFNMETMGRVIDMDSKYPKAMIMDKSENKINFAKTINEIEAIHPSIKWVKENKKIIPDLDLKIRPWTANSKDDMALCFDLGLAGFHTDFPEKAMSEKNKR
ncbi:MULTISPECIES: glycerophosphodiester phosphodiesterase [Vagococcus]|uniref:Glycerophosphoryl diester phosphodiesterase n=1 Tax=Vagococcus fluvialis bH819 TaxID=1255619 RepID=A0A1X6WQS4_9ENTE|nr:MULTISPECIES: glycerophosphodiester phosphodiesterase [Vagococcus]SLM86683.1 Glycerophosphoryl diester phosphodiesterase [Vagococcus fluvialis bH819]HCM90891.1 glycerophosphodiester phosphodiesterase [Vagococcus sp.]